MSDVPSCIACGKTQPEVLLQRCGHCQSAIYCSRECQMADWDVHRKVCVTPTSFQQPSSSFASTIREVPLGLSPPKGLEGPIAMPFTRLDNRTWLHGRSELDVYRLLVDVHRLRVADEYFLEGVISEDTIYAAAYKNPRADLLRGFRRFLSHVTSRPGLLPPWWSPGKQVECEVFAMDATQWHCLRFGVHELHMVERYGDSFFLMQLRMFAEDVYLRAVGGSSGAHARAVMMAREQGTLDFTFTPSIDHLSNMTFNLRP